MKRAGGNLPNEIPSFVERHKLASERAGPAVASAANHPEARLALHRDMLPELSN